MKTVKIAAAVLVVAVGGVMQMACVASTDSIADEPVFTETHVHQNPDGTTVVHTREITLSEELQENQERELRAHGEYPGLGTDSQAISRDTTCGTSSLWINDQANQIGNRICFSGAGDADLDSYCRTSTSPPFPICTDFWGSNVRSYWSGTDWGYFSGHYTCGTAGGACPVFSANQRVDNASTCEQVALKIRLDGSCTPA